MVTHFAVGHAAVDDNENQRQDNNDNEDGPEPWTLVGSVYHRLHKAALRPTFTNIQLTTADSTSLIDLRYHASVNRK